MKTIVLACTWMIVQSLSAQKTTFNHWSLEVARGINKAAGPFTSGYSSSNMSLPAIEFGGRYMFNSYGGIRLEAGYNRIGYTVPAEISSGEFVSNYWRLSAEAVMNMGQILDFYSINPRLGLLANIGTGLSSLSNDSLKMGIKSGSDKMIHISFGVSPLIRLTDRLTIAANFRCITHVHQSRTFDLHSTVQEQGMNGRLLSGTIGLQLYLGKASSHIDWYDERTEIQRAIEKRQGIYDSLVKAWSDSDHDGVPNYQDEESLTAEGARVTVKGVTIPPEPPVIMETNDSDTIAGFVELPEKKELFFSVQVGYYEEKANLEKKYGLQSLMTARTKSGDTRYLYGSCDKLEDAIRMKDIAFERGITDAFVVAYYQGKRITIAHAERLLLTRGKIILEPVK